MRNWSIPAGRIFGVDIRIDFSFLLLLGFVAFSQQAAHSTVNPWRGGALVAIVFGSVVLHELGHALVGKHSGVPPRAIVLMPIGGVTIFDETQPALPANWRRDARIAAAGPAVNLVAAAISALVLTLAFPNPHLWAYPYVTSTNLPHSILWTNLWLAAFNLCPLIQWTADGCCGRFSAAPWTRCAPRAGPSASAEVSRWLSHSLGLGYWDTGWFL